MSERPGCRADEAGMSRIDESEHQRRRRISGLGDRETVPGAERRVGNRRVTGHATDRAGHRPGVVARHLVWRQRLANKRLYYWSHAVDRVSQRSVINVGWRKRRG